MSGATIGGQLDCISADLLNAKGVALNADGAKIEGYVLLRGGFKAEGEVRLLGATIGGQLDCTSAQLSNTNGMALNADGVKIEGNVFLRNGFKAEGEVILLSATIGGDLDCTGAHFSKVTLSRTTIGNLAICNLIKAEQTILSLRFTKVGTFSDDQKSWPKPGNLFLEGFRYERLSEKAPLNADARKKWLRLQPQDKFLPQPYEQLAAVLRQMGHERDARLVMIEKNRELARFTRFPQQGWWWFNFFGKLIGYGYAPWRSFAISVAMILLGTFLFHFGFSACLVSPTKEKDYVKSSNGHPVLDKCGRPEVSEDYPVFNAFVYSLESFIPLIKFDQSASWTPNANRYTEISEFQLKVPTGRLLRYYLYFHIAAGWLFTSLWVGAVTGLVKS